MRDIDDLLQTYSFEELLELNDVTIEEAVEFLLEEEFIQYPPVLPL